MFLARGVTITSVPAVYDKPIALSCTCWRLVAIVLMSAPSRRFDNRASRKYHYQTRTGRAVPLGDASNAPSHDPRKNTNGVGQWVPVDGVDDNFGICRLPELSPAWLANIHCFAVSIHEADPKTTGYASHDKPIYPSGYLALVWLHMQVLVAPND